MPVEKNGEENSAGGISRRAEESIIQNHKHNGILFCESESDPPLRSGGFTAKSNVQNKLRIMIFLDSFWNLTW